MKIIKRNGSEEDFNPEKIANAVRKANKDVTDVLDQADETVISDVANLVTEYAASFSYPLTVEQIQDRVELALMEFKHYELAKRYIKYRYTRQLARSATALDDRMVSIVELKNEEVKQENSNKNPTIVSVQRDYMAGEVSRDLTNRLLLPQHIVDAHKKGIIHFHDSDYYAQHMHNCDLVNLEDMLQNGTVISGTLIEKPHSFATACNIATQIIAQVASSQYGGQSISLAHLAPFVDVSRKKIRKQVEHEFQDIAGLSGYAIENSINKIVEERLHDEVKRGIQTIQYQVVTLMTTNGQAPFITVFMYLNEVPEGQLREDLAMMIEEVLKQRIQGVKNKKGVWITPAFPKLIYVLEENNIHKDSKYHYLTELAARCTAKRMVPDYISEKKMLEYKIDQDGQGHCYTCMGCRSFLTPYLEKYVITEDMTELPIREMYDMNKDHADPEGFIRPVDCYTEVTSGVSKHKVKAKITRIGKLGDKVIAQASSFRSYGRLNQGVVTINLPHAALSALSIFTDNATTKMKLDAFWQLLHERLELCHEGLKCRHERLEGTPSDEAPILWQHGALARLDPGETIDRLLHEGYSTISLGYAGLWECVYALIGKKLTDPEGEKLGLEIMEYLNEHTASWKAAEHIDYSLYGTPLESTTYKFAKALQRDFGNIEGVSDKNYVTNSYHVHVTEDISAFDKLELEAKFQKLSPGGAISYVEVPNMQHNIPAVLSVMEFIYEHIMYAELNTRSDFCMDCGYEGEIEVIEENSKLVWRCPNCGCTDQTRMNVVRRTCGYIGTQYWNQGRTQEIKERKLHL